ncbi:MAG: aldo/keto reductase [Polaribacter sp.]|nr:aldo/keto reductase [Polaribacter sp.]
MKLNSRIIIGCMSWGKWGKEFDTKQQIDLLNFCVENGFTTFDHADIYGDYTTETRFGEAFIKSGIDRKSIQLISKCGIQYVGETRNNHVKHYNYSKDYMIWSVHQSLQNLQTDYLDVFLLHRPSALMHPDEIAEAIHQLKKEDKILHFGVSNFTPSQVDLINSRIEIETNQIEFSLTQHSAIHSGSLDQMLMKGILPMSWSPLGNYFKADNEQNKRIKNVLEKHCNKYQVDEDVLLLAWILKHPSKVAPVIGTTNKERILASKKALTIDLELQDWFELLVASQGHKVA